MHRLGTPHFIARTIEVIPGRMLRLQYVEGDIRGEGTWTLEPEGNQTRLRFRWCVRPHRLLFRLLAPFVDFGRTHSEVMQVGFVRLDRYLAQQHDVRASQGTPSA